MCKSQPTDDNHIAGTAESEVCEILYTGRLYQF